MSIISDIYAREILDSRGNPTVEVDVYLESGAFGRFAVPSGASTGVHEAVELRDNDKSRFMGKGVMQAVNNVNQIIAPQLLGLDALQQKLIDQILIDLDGTKQKSRLGANAILGVSMAIAKAAADYLTLPLYQYIGGVFASTLPVPFFNILNGGKHADNNVSIQEFMIAPIGAVNFADAYRYGSEVYHSLKKVLKGKGLSTSIGDEGGFAPNLSSDEEALKVIVEAIERAGYRPGKDVAIAIDAAASSFYSNGIYTIDSQEYDYKALTDYYKNLLDKYPIISLEDPLAEDDWEGWKYLTMELKDRVEIVGDDIFVTNKERLKKGIQEGIANSILIKLNQIGTLTETLETVEIAKINSYQVFVSHRSGETIDSAIADLVVAINGGQIKTGAPARGERVEKYNQLLRIEETLGEAANFAGSSVVRSSVEKVLS